MSKSHLLSNLIALVLLFSIGVQNLNAQKLPYETVTVDGREYYKYSVQPGEGLYAISRTFSVTVAEILRSNPGANSGLQSGQQLLIPVGANDQTAQSQQPQQQQSSPADQNINFKHTVISGETVYSISKMYNTTVDEIYRLNPGSKETLSIGQVLTIPQRRVISEVKEENYRYHTILPKETMYSVSRTYSLRPDDIMAANPGLTVETFQIGKTIRIPFFESYEVIVPFDPGATSASVSRQQEQEANQLLTQREPSQRVDIIKIGLLLPFLDETGGAHLRLQEYYEGFALATLEMKNRGADLELYVFEIGKGNDTKKLESLLQTMEMQELDLIIGGVNDAQIRTLSDFSKANNVKYVVPFSQSNGEVLNNGNIFQVNPLPKSLIDKTSRAFIQTFKNDNIIFVSGGQNDKMDLLAQLQSDLRSNNIRYETISATSTLNSTLLALLNSSRDNVIVPTSGDLNTLQQIIDELNELKEENPDFRIRLFGYPEWQTYSNLIPEYHKFGTYIYSSFFVDKNSPEAKAFQSNFRKWYGRDLMETNPGYGMWGYDTGLFFITAMERYGVNFEQNIDQIRVNSIQFPFRFERLNNWGGFFNMGLYFVYYDPNGQIIKMDKSR